jgi:predicted transcriptional regulator
MGPEEPNTLFAFKAIALAATLSTAEKRVASAIIDHFNRATGQCDPGINRLAGLLQISRSSVIRAIAKLERLGFLRRTRHGGHYHRNSYAPCWEKFRQLNASWAARFVSRRHASAATVTPSRSQPRDGCRGRDETQTCLNNLSNVTLAERTGIASHNPPAVPGAGKGHSGEASKRRDPPTKATNALPRQPTPFRDVARSAAERRWNADLLDAIGADSPAYARIVEAMTPDLQHEATQAEIAHRGDGLRLILERLRSRIDGIESDGIDSGNSPHDAPTPVHGSFRGTCEAGSSDRDQSAVTGDFESLNSTKPEA